jgi:hypothetical protein
MAAKARNFTVIGSEFVAENFYERLVQAADSGEHTEQGWRDVDDDAAPGVLRVERYSQLCQDGICRWHTSGSQIRVCKA